MLRRLTTVVALGVVAALSLVTPAWADHTTAHTIAQMTAHYQDPGLEAQNRPFALLYLRTTEGMGDANNEGEFSDPRFWDTEVIPTFATYYLDAYAAWKHGDLKEVDPAWRIAFRANPSRLNCTQLLYLGINAHVNNDLAFMIEEMGARYTFPDHKHVDDVLAYRTRPVVYPEIQRELCPGLFSETVPPGADADIFAWRQLAWDNAQRLLAAPTDKARDRIARQIRRHAKDKAHEILNWYRERATGQGAGASARP
jgi:Family of unknown function (DUF5995)